MTRHCSRTGCAEWPTDATLTYQYARSVAWLDALSGERDPHGYDLCERHAAPASEYPTAGDSRNAGRTSRWRPAALLAG